MPSLIQKCITIKATAKKHTLIFKQASGTSRGVLTKKDTYYLSITDGNKLGIGECSPLFGLSIDNEYSYELTLNWVCTNIHLGLHILGPKLVTYPSILYGVEMAFKSLASKTPFVLFPSAFTEGKAQLPINGLIWMGEQSFMKSQIVEKIKAGFNCIKLKIGALDFQSEINVLNYIRTEFTSKDICIRVDANGAFKPNEALEKLKRLSELDIHSIEQPIKPNQIEDMAKLCNESPLPIALDEELIAVLDVTKQEELLQILKPQYIILKPSLLGGMKRSENWIQFADKLNIGWWITSALESNVGLNAIAQWTYNFNVKQPQGLGTGSLFKNNIASPLVVEQGMLGYDTTINWQFKL